MGRIFVDSSALIAILNADDRFHEAARTEWNRVVNDEATLWTSNYVVVEASALVQRRMGLDGLSALHDTLLPVIQIDWVDAAVHQTAVAVVFAARRRELSLVDCSSFQIMRRLGIDTVLTFDPHFGDQGFRVVPERP